MYNCFLHFNFIKMKSVYASSYLEAANCEGNSRSLLERELNTFSPKNEKEFVRSFFSLYCGRQRGNIFSKEGLDNLMQKIDLSLTDKKIKPEDRIQVLQIFTKYLLVSRASVFSGISPMDEATERSKTPLRPDVDSDFDKFIDDDPENQVSKLALEIKDMILKVTFKDLSNDEVLVDTVLQKVSKKLISTEGVSPDVRIRFMQNVCKYLILAQLELTEDKEVEDAVLEKFRIKGLIHIDKLSGARDANIKKKEAPGAKNYLMAIHSLVSKYNPSVSGSDKIRPDIVDHVWCCDLNHSDGLPDTFRHVLPYLVYLKVMFAEVKSVDQISTDWKKKFEDNFLLSEQAQSLFKLAMSGYFPKLRKRVIGGVEKTVRRLLKASKAGDYKDWFELLKQRQGDDYEIANGITLKDLADKIRSS